MCYVPRNAIKQRHNKFKNIHFDVDINNSRPNLKLHKSENFFGSDFEFYTFL